MKEEYITEQVEKEETTDLSLLAFGQMIENKFKQDIDEDSQDNYENVMPLPSQTSNQIMRQKLLNHSSKKVHNFTPITNKKP